MQDEELPQRSALHAWLWRAAAVLVGVVIVVAAVAKLRSTPQPGLSTVTVPPSSPSPSPPPTATASSSRTPVADKPPAVLDPLHRLSRAAIDAAHVECPHRTACTTTGETPAAVTDALRAAFPRATHLVAVSDISYRAGGGPRLTFRRLSASVGRATVAVEVRPSSAGDGAATSAVVEGPQRVARSETIVDGLSVEVQISAPAPRTLDLATATRLAADRRLLATG